VIAVGLYDGEVDFIEIKCSAGDLRRETPEKSAPFLRYASRRWIAARSPWKDVVPSKSLLPHGFGLLSVGTGAPVVVVPAEETEPAESLSPFELALLRAAATTAEHAASDAPPVEVIRPFLSRGHVGLGCHHVAMSLAKPLPPKLPCWGCFEGRPTEPEAIEAASPTPRPSSSRGTQRSARGAEPRKWVARRGCHLPYCALHARLLVKSQHCAAIPERPGFKLWFMFPPKPPLPAMVDCGSTTVLRSKSGGMPIHVTAIPSE
jgi:hypothetical protein